jgi:hypothetical protein
MGQLIDAGRHGRLTDAEKPISGTKTNENKESIKYVLRMAFFYLGTPVFTLLVMRLFSRAWAWIFR